jgi:hypothetical protein
LVDGRSEFTWGLALPLLACMARWAILDEPIGLEYNLRIKLT